MDKKLHEICEENNVKLTIYGVDEIAQQLYGRYPVLAKDLLGVSVDTNQIMDVKEFVKTHDACKTLAPLDTIFQNREELEIINGKLKENKVVIVSGPAGVGKTRIVIEAIRKVANEEGYRLLCVKNNNLPIFEDLIVYTEIPGRYLFFIDDANDFFGLNHILDNM